MTELLTLSGHWSCNTLIHIQPVCIHINWSMYSTYCHLSILYFVLCICMLSKNLLFMWQGRPFYIYKGWSFTTLLNHKVAIWCGIFRLTARDVVPVHSGADSLKKPHHIATLWFSVVVIDHPIYVHIRLVNIISWASYLTLGNWGIWYLFL